MKNKDSNSVFFSGSSSAYYDTELRFRLLFIRRIMTLTVIIGLVMAYVRYTQDHLLLAAADFGFALIISLLLPILLKSRSQRWAEGVILLILGISFLFFSAIYVMVPDNASRIYLFFLLIASSFFLKGRETGFYMVWLSIFVILFFHLHDAFDTGYSDIEVFTAVIYLLSAYAILHIYDALKEKQSQNLQRLNDSLERKIKERTADLELANAKLLKEACQLEKLSSTDQLSGLYNRHKISELFAYEQAQVKRDNTPLCAILIDIDHFKAINDRHGHNMGDSVIKRIAALLAANTRKSDSVGRWGGEEFLILLPRQEISQAIALAEKLRKLFEKDAMIPGSTVTISCGVTAYIAGESMECFVERADIALYRAKEQGRNRVVTELEQTLPSCR